MHLQLSVVPVMLKTLRYNLFLAYEKCSAEFGEAQMHVDIALHRVHCMIVVTVNSTALGASVL